MTRITPSELANFRASRQHEPLLTLQQTRALDVLSSTGGMTWEGLDVIEKIAVTVALRELALHVHHHPDDDDARHTLAASVALVEPLCTSTLQGLSLSYYPTPAHCCVRFMTHHPIEAVWQPFFTREAGDASHLTAVFVDPEEFHFRTFEYIVPLERFFARISPHITLRDPLMLDTQGRAMRWRAQLDAPTKERLLNVDRANLYLPPLNHNSRGGQRLIFHCASLASALTRAVQDALPADFIQGFSHVNPVFRCNRFTPRDDAFISHHDTPYYDRARGHISRYTMLLYMTGGHASPALRIDKRNIHDIAAWTCVIFDQSLEHEGRPFEDDDKLFLRTELIFEATDLPQEPHIASLFSQACALTGESLRDERVAQHVHALYDAVASAHFNGLTPPEEELFLHKTFGDIHYICNGHDYWFEDAQLSLNACAAIVILDYFNCKLHDTSYRKLCASMTLPHKEGRAWIAPMLRKLARIPEHKLPTHFDKALLFPKVPTPDHSLTFPDELRSYSDNVAHGMRGPYFHVPDILEIYASRLDDTHASLKGAPILFMGQEVWLDDAQFVVHGNQLFVGSHTPVAPLNFAATETLPQTPEDYVNVKVAIDAPYLLLPPILFTRHEDGTLHLMCDFFQNAWMTTHKENPVNIPQLHKYW